MKRKATARAAPRFTPKRAPELAKDAHKGDAGRVLCVVGSRWMPGAAVLVARACQRAGAGLVTLGLLDDALLGTVPNSVAEAVYLDLGGAADIEPKQLARLLARRKDHVIVAGCGLSTSERSARFIDALLAAKLEVPMVLDADALNLIAGSCERVRAVNASVVLTPHPGEAERLLGRAIAGDESSRIAAAREMTRRCGATVCLKGHRTVVASGDELYVNDTGNPGMATAGSGDVLAGILGAYLVLCNGGKSRRWSPFEAASSAVRVHGLAGDLAARELGERGVIASDLIAFLPRAARRMRA